MIFNYLKKHYLDDEKLAQRARLEFYRALSTGRMVAFTGSMTTQAFGYGSWPQLRMTFSALAADAAREAAPQVAEAMLRHITAFDSRSAKEDWRGPVGMSLVEEVLDRHTGPLENRAEPEAGRPWPLDIHETLREKVRVDLAKRFRAPHTPWQVNTTLTEEDFNKTFNVPDALWTRLGIRRFATLAYDFELERRAMLADPERTPGEADPFDRLVRMRSDTKENFSWDLGSGRIRRVFPDGWAIESDLLNRERIDRMIEFAVGTDDVDGHIMHLHGRADNWRTMIVTQTDYDNLYRRNDLNRAPFEFTKRLMIGGNPILFVGLGMSEEEVNRELQEFISDNPFQRVAPIFLLWSAGPANLKPDQIEAKRMDMLRRLGVLTIFDTDFESRKDDKRPTVRERNASAQTRFNAAIGTAILNEESLFKTAAATDNKDLLELAQSVDLLAEGVNGTTAYRVNPMLREQHVGEDWRSMAGRVAAAQAKGIPTVLWETRERKEGWETRERDKEQQKDFCIDRLIERANEYSMVCVIGPQGCGKGAAASALAHAGAAKLGLNAESHCLLINGGFSFDTDTVLDATARFLSTVLIGEALEGPPKVSRPRLFETLGINEERGSVNDPRALIVINGMDRFFNVAGHPLSAELDAFIQQATKRLKPPRGKTRPKDPRVRFVFFGTERVRAHMEALGVKVVNFQEFQARPEDDPQPGKLYDRIPGMYLNQIWTKIRGYVKNDMVLRGAVDRYRANLSGQISGDTRELQQALFGAAFDEDVLSAVLGAEGSRVNTRAARQLLKALAFIGVPVELDVLRLMPGLLDGASSTADEIGASQLSKDEVGQYVGRTLSALCDAGLVLSFDHYRTPHASKRASPPRYALHRSLLTELRYRYGIPLSEAKLSTAFNMSLYVAQPIDGDIPDTDIHDELGQAIDNLIGSYRFSPPRLGSFAARAKELTLHPDDYRKVLIRVADACGSSRLPTEDRHFIDIERLCSRRHGRALRTALALVRSYYSTTGLLTLDSGDRLIRQGRDGVLLEHAERLDDLIDAYGKRALARTAMLAALGPERFERHFGEVEPFYADELVWLHNERGVVRLAMGDLYEARRSFDQAMAVNRRWVEANDRAHNWRRIRLNQVTVDIEMGEIGVGERKCDEIIAVSRADSDLRESRLATAIAHGYKGWCLHLRGQVESALASYRTALIALSDLGEVRAQAYFGRLEANAMHSAAKPEDRRQALERALSLAQSAVQMDIVHRLQVTLADTYIFGKEETLPHERTRAHRYLEEALTYSLHTNVHRVRCEASTVTARTRLMMSDFEGALRYATDALMVATRYGMELRKISLRALIAKIMAARGHPVTAENLARTCIKMATRQRYQTAIDEASDVILGIQRISTAISNPDRSGLRQY